VEAKEVDEEKSVVRKRKRKEKEYAGFLKKGLILQNKRKKSKRYREDFQANEWR
jgi:hypothetical protein